MWTCKVWIWTLTICVMLLWWKQLLVCTHVILSIISVVIQMVIQLYKFGDITFSATLKKKKKSVCFSTGNTDLCCAAFGWHCSQRFGPVNIDFWSNLAVFIFHRDSVRAAAGTLVQWYELAAIRFFWSILVMFWVRNHHIIVLKNMDIPGLLWCVSW